MVAIAMTAMTASVMVKRPERGISCMIQRDCDWSPCPVRGGVPGLVGRMLCRPRRISCRLPGSMPTPPEEADGDHEEERQSEGDQDEAEDLGSQGEGP